MTQFKAAFLNELTRIFRKRKTVVFCIIDIIIIVSHVLLGKIPGSVGFALSSVGSLLNLHGLFFWLIFPLYIFMETMDVFAGEMSNLSIRNVLIRPVTRTKIYLAKACAVCAFILAQILFVGIFGAIFSGIMGDGALTVVRNIAAFIITFIPMIAFVFMASCVSQIVKNGLVGMLLCIFFLLVAYVLEALAPTISAFLFVRHVNMYKMV